MLIGIVLVAANVAAVSVGTDDGVLAAPQLLNGQSVAKTGNRASFATLQQLPKGATVAVTVDTMGTINRCDAQSDNEEYKINSCNLMFNKAKFSPAVDEKGHPSFGVYRTNILWDGASPRKPFSFDYWFDVNTLPKGVPDPAIVTLSIAVDTFGKVSACRPFKEISAVRIKGRTDDSRMVALGCRQMRGLSLKPALIKSGEPVASVQMVTIQFNTPSGTRPSR